MKKILIRAVAVILVLLVIAVLIIWAAIDPIAKKAVEKGAGYALRVDTRLDKMDLSLLNGTVVMDGLHISNPEGFTSPHLMRSGRFDLAVRIGSLFSDTVEVDKFVLDGLDVNIEQRLGGSNVSEIIGNLKRFDTGDDKDEKEGKKVRINRIVIRNVVAHFHLLPEFSSGGPITVNVPEIELESVTSDDADGVVVSQLVTRLVPAILAAVIEKGRGAVPGDFLNGLDGQIGGLGKVLGEQANKLIKQAGSQLKLDLKSVVPTQPAKAVKNVLDNILDGKKDEKKNE